MEEGAGPLPILMGGGASQSSLRGGIVMPPVAVANAPGIPGAPPRNRSASAATRGPSQDAIVDKFVSEYLANDLMKMGPQDGLIEDPAHNWVLGGEGTDLMLIDARSVCLSNLRQRCPTRATREFGSILRLAIQRTPGRSRVRRGR